MWSIISLEWLKEDSKNQVSKNQVSKNQASKNQVSKNQASKNQASKKSTFKESRLVLYDAYLEMLSFYCYVSTASATWSQEQTPTTC